eukprot:TRINITY_DN4967_c0_g1_i1.p1 TRINITY_DN4967_c0_g1~~TRINITY_DN4967_c0_g1_i1.p1  ORF type:complete len:349 (-),score=60.61 TRINITY_DN4967_c0_g1_i1:56-1102(-)
MAQVGSEIELANPPTDGVSSLCFGVGPSPLLLATSWDCTSSLYNVNDNTLRARFEHDRPILCGVFPDRNRFYVGSLDGSFCEVDISSGDSGIREIGVHEKAIRCVSYCVEKNVLVTGSWDSTCKVWDLRSSSPLVSTIPLPNKVFTMDLSNSSPNSNVSPSKLVVGTAARNVYIYDLRNLGMDNKGSIEPIQRRESSLKYQTRTIKCFPDGSGYALSSIEGRVAMEYFDPSPASQARKYAFKCHRQTVDGQDVVYPVNAISFHPSFGTFATGGGDGIINIWDGQNKKRLCQFHRYPTSISALAFDPTGTILAIANSYTFEEGEKTTYPPDTILIRNVTEAEVKPKPRV